MEPPKARKSLGAEVNWGVRFKSDEEARKFLQVGNKTGPCHPRNHMVSYWPFKWSTGQVFGCASCRYSLSYETGTYMRFQRPKRFRGSLATSAGAKSAFLTELHVNMHMVDCNLTSWGPPAVGGKLMV